MSEGSKDEEENFRYLIKLLVKIREMELSRQMEKDQNDFAERQRKLGGFYHNNGYERPYVQVLTNEQFIHFQTIDSR